jgi:hypothetical protein
VGSSDSALAGLTWPPTWFQSLTAVATYGCGHHHRQSYYETDSLDSRTQLHGAPPLLRIPCINQSMASVVPEPVVHPLVCEKPFYLIDAWEGKFSHFFWGGGLTLRGSACRIPSE